ncbi:copper chaperone PCu(A)C [Aquicoccus sp. SCR17]|nr:copper chaperone PCu(A)C [Carideicomes alvinocaridis]
MPIKTLIPAALGLILSTLPAWAEITIEDAYARSSNPMSGGAFLTIHNDGEADRLTGIRSDAAKKVELHTTEMTDDGVMKMMAVEGGLDLPANGTLELKRGGNHVMFMGLTEPFEPGKTVPITLIFEKAGEVQVDVPVDLDR